MDRIVTERITHAELHRLLGSGDVDELVADGVTTLIVDLATTPSRMIGPKQVLGSWPVVVIGVSGAGGDNGDGDGLDAESKAAFDVIVDAGDPVLAEIVANVERTPLAAIALVVLLRQSEQLSVEHALAAESAVYSLLQSGPEFATWRVAAGRSSPPPDPEPAVLAARDRNVLRIELNRPHRHNAFSTSMRDALYEMLNLACTDESIAHVELSGRGPSFCSGGDLGEFGSFPDPATAHRTRLARSPARLMHRLRDRVDVHLHGSCLGAGVELPAFAARVTATPDAMLGLPELTLGLVPGAGGTVSLPRRIGRLRTAHLALSTAAISAPLAQEWGLVDAIIDAS